MIVDDVFFNIDILKNVLKKVLKVNVKKEIVEAYNGKQAVDKFKKNQKKHGENTIKLILMDCDMPIMNGFEATKKILEQAKKANGPIPYIVAVTGDSTEQNVNFANEAGMSQII